MKKINARVKIICFVVLMGVLYACASDGYTYYGLNVSAVEKSELAKGQMLAKDPSKDLDLTECIPTKKNKSPCVIMFSSEFFKAMRDLEEYKARLKACETN
jgi:hypothetical protein